MHITSFHAIGISPEEGSLKAIKLRFQRKKILATPFIDVKPLYKDSSAVFMAPIDTRDVLFRVVSVPKVRGSNYKVSLAFQLEPQIPYPIDEALVQSVLLKKEKKNLSFLAYAVKREVVESRLEELKKWQIIPHVIETIPNALFALTPWITNFTGILLHLSKKGTTLIIAEKNKPLTIKYCDIGCDAFEAHGHALLSKVKEWQKEIHYLLHPLKVESKSIIILGENFKNSYFLFLLQQGLAYTLCKPEISEKLKISPDDFIDFALPLGLALLANPKNKVQINFLPKEPNIGWLKKNFFIFLGVCTLFTVAHLLFSMNLLNQHKMAIERQEKQLDQLKKNLLSVQDLQIKTPYPYPLRPNVAKVGEVLAWLSNLPPPPGIQIEKIHYSLTHLPTKKTPKDNYQCRIELECRASIPENIRVFQEKLLEDKTMILQGKEFQFVQNKEGFQTSFLLKPQKRTP